MYQIVTKAQKSMPTIYYLCFIRNELELCETASGTYKEKLLDPNVKGVVNENKLKFEPLLI